MVFPLYLNKLHFFPENFQRIEQLNTLTNGNIGIHCPVKKEQRSIYLVRVEERTLLGV